MFEPINWQSFITNYVHYVNVAGDQAFPLLPQLMRPFPSSQGQAAMRRIFNYRHCRARRVIENAFGILASRFRIFRKPIISSPETVDKVVQATVVLHNWLRTQDIHNNVHNKYVTRNMVDHEDEEGHLIEGSWRQEPPPVGRYWNTRFIVIITWRSVVANYKYKTINHRTI